MKAGGKKGERGENKGSGGGGGKAEEKESGARERGSENGEDVYITTESAHTYMKRLCSTQNPSPSRQKIKND